MPLALEAGLESRDYADVIQKGRNIKIATDTRPSTIADLFEGYVASLKAAGKPSRRQRKAPEQDRRHARAQPPRARDRV